MRRCFACILGLGLSLPSLAAAQRTQELTLQVRPRVGDTLWTVMEQEQELTRVGGSASMVNGVQVYSHAIVESATLAATVVITAVDSMLMYGGTGRAAMATGRRDAQRQRLLPSGTPPVRIRIAPNGAMQAGDDDRASGDDRQMLSLIPASFPREAVAIGDRWTREVTLPGAGLGAAPLGALHATFRLDSLGRRGDVAYVSLRGELSPQGRPITEGSRTRIEGGTLTGTLVLDRRRGWVTESRYVLLVNTLVAASAAANQPEMRFQMRVSQRVRTMDKR